MSELGRAVAPSRRNVLAFLGAAPITACVTPKVRARGPINREEFAAIGGSEQFISIRGDGLGNPAVLFLHGGPGNAMSPFLSVFAPWEPYLTVVNWDQRGSGKTFGRNPDAVSDLTPERMTQDTIEVAEHVRKILGKRRLVLCCHSAGAMTGWRAVQARPDLFAAFVGTGMMVGYARTLGVQEAYARSQAQAAGDAAALKAMDEARLLPIDDIRRPRPIRRWLMTDPQDLAYLEKVQQPFLAQASTSAEARAWTEGQRQTTAPNSLAIAAMLAYDMAKDGASSKIPVAVIQGRNDRIAPSELAQGFVDALNAPSKRFVAIEGGHFACFTNPGEFVPALRDVVGRLKL